MTKKNMQIFHKWKSTTLEQWTVRPEPVMILSWVAELNSVNILFLII